MNRLWLLLGALAALGGGAWLARPVAQAGARETPMTETEQFEQWVDPASGERVSLRFDGHRTTVERGAAVSVVKPRPFDAAAELAQAQAQLKEMNRWDVLNALSWRERWLSGRFRSLDEAKTAFVAAGFPQKLWADMDAFARAIGRPVPGDKEAGAYAGSLSLGSDGKVTVYRGASNSETTFYLSDPQWKDNLLIHPTPGILRVYNGLQVQNVSVAPPQPAASFDQQRGHLVRQGFVRLTARRPDGSLWLPPVLEAYRKPLTASAKPVLRLSAAPERTPALWDSKLGGAPYRPRGTAWPMSHEKIPRPLVFLAQINLAQANLGGQNLPEYPSQGILQFFILNSEFYGADAMYGAQGGMPDLSGPQDNYRVIYFPDVVQDAAKLETRVPQPLPDPAEVAQLRKLGYTSLLDDENLIWEKLPLKRELIRTDGIALTFTPDREPVSGGDDSSKRLGLPANYWDDQHARQVVSALYALSPGGHKLGGYPDFTQSDPRRADHDWQLLFQLDSDDRLGLMWGDVGTANFFIRPADLRRRDFSQVAYHWDCG